MIYFHFRGAAYLRDEVSKVRLSEQKSKFIYISFVFRAKKSIFAGIKLINDINNETTIINLYPM